MAGASTTQVSRLTQRDVARAGREGPRLGAADRPRHDAGPDRERVGRRREVRRRGPVLVRPARQHRLERRRPETADGSDPRPESARRVAGRAGLAADRRRFGDGERRRAPAIRDTGQESVPDWREASCVGHPEDRRHPNRLRLESVGVGEGSGRQHEEDRRNLPRGVHGRGRVRRTPRRRRRDLLGRHAQLEAEPGAARTGQSSADSRLSGRHGPYAPVHAGIQRTRGSSAAREVRLGTAARRSTMRCRG